MSKVLLSTLAVLCGFASVNVSTASPLSELTTNGGFELGDTSFWQYFPTTSSTFTVTNDANSGSFAGDASNTAIASAAVLKQANLGVGAVSPGDPITVSFAAKGSSAAGGVVFAEFFSEISGGGVSSSEILGGAPLALTSEWQTFTFMTTAGSDVSGGVTLQFAVVTGADPMSSSVLMLDDVSVSTAELGTNYCIAAINSTGASATMSASGSTSLAANDLVLQSATQPAGQPGLFYFGPMTTQDPFGDGFRCVSGSVKRLPAISADGAGVMTYAVDYTAAPASSISAGQTLYFQSWYRDPAAGLSGFNLSDGLELTFLP